MASKSFASRRLRPIQAKNRSTTQRRGFTAKPIWSGFLRTISTAINVALATRVNPLAPNPRARAREGAALAARARGWCATAPRFKQLTPFPR